MWLARFDGRTGRPIAQASFGQGAAVHRPVALAVGPKGTLFVTGTMVGQLAFGGRTEPLVSEGGQDVFVARLDARRSGFSPAWAKRLGTPLVDQAAGLAVDGAGYPWISGAVTAVPGGSTGLANLGGSATHSATIPFVAGLDGRTGATRTAAAFGESAVAMRVAVTRDREGREAVVIAGEGGLDLELGELGKVQVGPHDFLLVAR
jgi:hypothetical protein